MWLFKKTFNFEIITDWEEVAKKRTGKSHVTFPQPPPMVITSSKWQYNIKTNSDFLQQIHKPNNFYLYITKQLH